jgi:LCP family protein required for cell wall assembly
VPLLPSSKGTLVIALLGADSARTSGIWRTDTIILAFIEQEERRLGLLSLPRDLWVLIPGYGYGRINTVDTLGEQVQPSGGGPALLDKTLRHNLGVSIDRYVRIDFDGFVRIIDGVGGVTVDVEKPVADIFPDPSSPMGEFELDLPVGPQHMDGRTALAYCRSRWATSDLDRSRRQQKVLMALWEQALTPEALARAPKLWATFSGAYETDLTMTEAIRLAQLVSGIDPVAVRSARLGATAVSSWTTPEGARVLLPRTDDIRRIILELQSLPD